MSPGGTTHEHIADYRWTSDVDGKVGSSDKATLVAWMDKRVGRRMWVTVSTGSRSGTVHPAIGQAYLRTYADNTWTMNLLSPPRF